MAEKIQVEDLFHKLPRDMIDIDRSGQIIATSHDLTPNGGLVREITLFQGNLGWWNIIPFGQIDM